MPKSYQKGFTVLELAIVLVVIGTIVGGVLVGQTLIRQSQISKLSTDEQRYVAAVKAFVTQYNYLPGDFPNATSYWGAMGTCPVSPGESQSGTQTCNGNGDGQVNPGTNYNGSTFPSYTEFYLFWQHLGNAGLIDGTYTGVPTNGNQYFPIIGTNAPAGSVPGGGWGIGYLGNVVGNAAWFDGSYGHYMTYGAPTGPAQELMSPLLSPAEMQSLDSKFDDGLPASGSIGSFKPGTIYWGNCLTSSTASTATYNTSLTGPQCIAVFFPDF
jgi:prepilin-type N-terminal cleavage/methylation domain-containing protein